MYTSVLKLEFKVIKYKVFIFDMYVEKITDVLSLNNELIKIRN